jgi:hypothetical protein
MSRFNKGQTIYRASEWHICHKDCSIYGYPVHHVYVVLSNVVDACGKKRVTFYDNGVRTICRSYDADNLDICATYEEALARMDVLIEKQKEYNKLKDQEDPCYAGIMNSTFQIVKTVYPDNESGYIQLRNDLSSLEHISPKNKIRKLLPSSFVRWFY